MKIGFVGLGIMGAPMARNLLGAGFELSVYNRTAEKCDALVAAGAKRCGSAAELGERSDVVVTIVSDTPDVEAVLFGGNGLAALVQRCQIELPIGQALGGGHDQPMLCAKAIIAGGNQPVGIKNPEIILGLSDARRGGLAIPISGGGEINWRPGGFKQQPEQELGVGMVLFRRCRENADRQRRVGPCDQRR